MAKKNYEHSKSFDKMKKVKEQVGGNLTSLQYLQTLDYLLWNAIAPIASECPSLFFNYLVKVIARQTLKASAKYSSDDRSKLPLQLFNTLTAATPELGMAASRKLFINRGLLFGFVSLFRRKLIFYSKLCSGTTKYSDIERKTLLYRIEKSIGLRSNGLLYPCLMQVTHWDDKAHWWKSIIVEKYTRMALMQAKNTYEDFNHYVTLDDVTQIYLKVVNRAIDRCDARQGVLTTFLQNWFKSARGEVAEQAKGQTDQSYESLTEEHGDAIHEVIGVTLPDVSMELQQHVSFLSKQVDPIGLVRTALGIREFVTTKQQQILYTLAVDDDELEYKQVNTGYAI